MDVLKDELKKNRELQDNVKQLQGDVDKFQDSGAMKKAKAAYERARVCTKLFESFGRLFIIFLGRSSRPVLKKILDYELQLKNFVKLESKSATLLARL